MLSLSSRVLVAVFFWHFIAKYFLTLGAVIHIPHVCTAYCTDGKRKYIFWLKVALDSECSGRKQGYYAASDRVRLPWNASFMLNSSTANISNSRACTSHSVYLSTVRLIGHILLRLFKDAVSCAASQHGNVSVYNPILGSSSEEPEIVVDGSVVWLQPHHRTVHTTVF